MAYDTERLIKDAIDAGFSQAGELNIKALDLKEDASNLVKRALKPNFSAMGPKFGKLMPKIQKALSGMDTNALAAEILAGRNAHLTVDGEAVELEASDVTVEMVTPENISAVEEAGTVVALDTELTPELVQEGLVRDLVRQIQNMRKDLGFNVDDRITIEYAAEGAFAEAFPAWDEYIRQETLANSVTPSSAPLEMVKVAGEEIGLKLEKA
jgi:isoleucyl-tRNA synthetase